MSSFLMYRRIINDNTSFTELMRPNYFSLNKLKSRTGVSSSEKLETVLKKVVFEATKGKKCAIALSGGIDSAILAKFMPKGSLAYTFKCIVPGIDVIDESKQAAKYAEECGLEHRVIEIYWEDFEKYSDSLMKKKGAPIHSIEVQIYKAALQAKKDGIENFVFGESADCIFGGLDGLLSKEWTVGEFVNRYSYCLPYYVLNNFEMDISPILRHADNGYVDVHSFLNDVFCQESLSSYYNACSLAKIEMIAPFSFAYMKNPLDYERVRNSDSKYLVREIFNKYYPTYIAPRKIPMPRPMNEWLLNWSGPTRSEFQPHCIEKLTGDQKWLVYILERFLNLIE